MCWKKEMVNLGWSPISSGGSVSEFLVVTGLGWRRCCSRLTWTTRVLFPSEISIVTGLLMDLIVQSSSCEHMSTRKMIGNSTYH